MSEVQPAQPTTPPGWYYDNGTGVNRWWDGYAWTANVQQQQAPVQQAPVIVVGRKHTSHGFHLLMSILTVGLWIPVWIIVSIANS